MLSACMPPYVQQRGFGSGELDQLPSDAPIEFVPSSSQGSGRTIWPTYKLPGIAKSGTLQGIAKVEEV